MKKYSILFVIVVLIITIWNMKTIEIESSYINLKNEVFTIEYGETLPLNSSYYIKNTNIDLDTIQVISDDDKTKNYPDIGNYTITLTSDKYEVTCVVKVEDTLSPNVEYEKYLYIDGTKASQDDIIKHLKINDLQACTIEYDNSLLNAGNELEVKVVDKSNNYSYVAIEIVEKKEAVDTKQNELLLKKESVEINDYSSESKKVTENMEVINSLKWYNEVTDEYYYGNKNIEYGFNVENEVYGGLVLVNNPNEIVFEGYQFIGGLQYVNTNQFKMSYIDESGRQIDLGLLDIIIPKSSDGSDIYDFYESRDES